MNPDETLIETLQRKVKELNDSLENLSFSFWKKTGTGSKDFSGSISDSYVTLDSFGHIKSGQTDYDTGIGFWLGNAAGTPKFSIGNAGAYKMTWDGSELSIIGRLS